MTHLYLVRHAEPVVDPGQPFDAWPLTAAGRHAARQLGETLPRLNRVVASPERKALETTSELAHGWAADIDTDDRLREVGDRAWADSTAAYRTQAKSYLAGAGPDGWEPQHEARQRIVAATGEIMSTPADALLVSHGLVLTLLRSWFDGVEPAMLVTVWASMRFPDICILDWDRRRVLREFGSDEPT